jgi:hypothetical protein
MPVIHAPKIHQMTLKMTLGSQSRQSTHCHAATATAPQATHLGGPLAAGLELLQRNLEVAQGFLVPLPEVLVLNSELMVAEDAALQSFFYIYLLLLLSLLLLLLFFFFFVSFGG